MRRSVTRYHRGAIGRARFRALNLDEQPGRRAVPRPLRLKREERGQQAQAYAKCIALESRSYKCLCHTRSVPRS